VPLEATSLARLRRVLLAGGLCVGVLVAGHVGCIWRRATDCQRTCSPERASGALRLQTGVSLPLLQKELRDGTLRIKYVTQAVVQDRHTVCSEANNALQALLTGEELAGVVQVHLEPTDTRLRVIGWRWSGPVFWCCMSTVVVCERDPDGKWKVSWGCGCE
jgi:hypothetical protein